jgi:hypothetical protein
VVSIYEVISSVASVKIFSGLHIGCLTCMLHSRPSVHLRDSDNEEMVLMYLGNITSLGIFSSGYFPGVCILKADVSEHCRFHLHRWVGVNDNLAGK